MAVDQHGAEHGIDLQHLPVAYRNTTRVLPGLVEGSRAEQQDACRAWAVPVREAGVRGGGDPGVRGDRRRPPGRRPHAADAGVRVRGARRRDRPGGRPPGAGRRRARRVDLRAGPGRPRPHDAAPARRADRAPGGPRPLPRPGRPAGGAVPSRLVPVVAPEHAVGRGDRGGADRGHRRGRAGRARVAGAGDLPRRVDEPPRARRPAGEPGQGDAQRRAAPPRRRA